MTDIRTVLFGKLSKPRKVVFHCCIILIVTNSTMFWESWCWLECQGLQHANLLSSDIPMLESNNFIQGNTVGLRGPDTGQVDRLVWASRESTIQNVFPACKNQLPSCWKCEWNPCGLKFPQLSFLSCGRIFQYDICLVYISIGTFFWGLQGTSFLSRLAFTYIHLKSQYMMLYCNSFSSSSFSSFPVVSFPGISVSYERFKNKEDLYKKSMTLYLRKYNTRYYYAQLHKLLTFTF